MSFNEVFPTRPATAAPVKVSLGITKHGARSIRVSFTAEGLKQNDIAVGDRLRVLVGDGASAGKVIVAPDSDGMFELKQNIKGSGYVRFPAPDWAPSHSVKPAPCKVHIDDGDLHLTLPPSFVVKRTAERP